MASSSGLPRPVFLLLLLYVGQAKPIEGRTRLEKLLFLIQKEIIERSKPLIPENSYDFRPYKFGPYTEEVFDDLELLRTLDYVTAEDTADEKAEYRLTEKGKKVIERLLREGKISQALVFEIERIKLKYAFMPLDSLLNEVYKRYPEYTSKSEILERFGSLG